MQKRVKAGIGSDNVMIHSNKNSMFYSNEIDSSIGIVQNQSDKNTLAERQYHANHERNIKENGKDTLEARVWQDQCRASLGSLAPLSKQVKRFPLIISESYQSKSPQMNMKVEKLYSDDFFSDFNA